MNKEISRLNALGYEVQREYGRWFVKRTNETQWTALHGSIKNFRRA